MSKVINYIEGMCRNQQHKSRSHIYAVTKIGNYWPMCDYGWNRSNGERFSIFRGHKSLRGTCKICVSRMNKNLKPVIKARTHKTRWL